MDFLFRPL